MASSFNEARLVGSAVVGATVVGDGVGYLININNNIKLVTPEPVIPVMIGNNIYLVILG